MDSKLRNLLAIFLISGFAISTMAALNGLFIGRYIAEYPLLSLLVSIGGVAGTYYFLMKG